jgi:hypothetical protein
MFASHLEHNENNVLISFQLSRGGRGSVWEVTPKHFAWLTSVARRAKSSLLYSSPGTKYRPPSLAVGPGNSGENIVASRRYIMRQVATLLRFAKETADPKVAAALVEKAERLKAQIDETRPPPDWSLRAPDVEPTPN